ncbi:MAG: response regulator transcription factor [Bacteroidota bacterium]|jgi:DNA-binding NarL/FixJ family response regulator
MISVCIASAVPLFREGLLRTLNDERGILVSVVAEESESVLHSCGPGHPDVVVLDITLPGDNTAALMRRLRQKGCQAAIVLFGEWNPESAGSARRLQSRALLSSFDDTDIFVRAVHYAAAGEAFVSDRVLAHIEALELSVESTGGKIDKLLTPTERLILRALAENRTSKEIAREMFISYRTVQKHRNNMVHKLHLDGSHSLLAFALRHFGGKR